MTTKNGKTYFGKTIGSLLIILLLMPLGHALMIVMEQLLTPAVLHYSAFAMGFVGLVFPAEGTALPSPFFHGKYQDKNGGEQSGKRERGAASV